MVSELQDQLTMATSPSTAVPLDSTAAMKSIHQSPIFLLSNMSNLISIKLDSSNFILWKYHIKSILRAYDLLGIIVGSKPCPTQFFCDDKGEITDAENPDFHQWNVMDQGLITLINSTLSSSALALVIGQTSSQGV
ncbi:unnamed protein product [Camellia sinensis]